MTLIEQLKRTGEEARKGTLNRREFLRTAGKAGVALSVASPLMAYSRQTSAQQPSQTETENKATFFPIYYKPGDLGYVEKDYMLSLDHVYSRVIEENDTILEWWMREEQSYNTLDLAKLIFLVLNKPEYYPKRFPEGFNLKKDDIVLKKGKEANFADINRDGKIFGQEARRVPTEEVLKITGMKDNYGRLLDEYRK